MSNFTTVAPKYEEMATLQKSASDRLFDILRITRTDDVLDLGCGTGHITETIRSLTDGIVVGIDPSEGMIAEARRNFAGTIEFHVGSAETLNMPSHFDVIFCNSAFQWFGDPSRAALNCHSALCPGGRIGIQAPARRNYCPSFLLAIDSLKRERQTQETFAHFHSPWFSLETAQDYADIFTRAGFSVLMSEIERVTQRCTPTRAFEMFESGAGVGYWNPEYYDIELPSDYVSNGRELVARSFHSQAASDGQVELTFFRVYLLAHKP